jgi:Na+/phosphate symporter
MNDLEKIPLNDLYDLLSEKTKLLLDAINRKDHTDSTILRNDLKEIQEMIRKRREQGNSNSTQ